MILRFVCLIDDIVRVYAKYIFEGDNKKIRKALTSTLNQSIKCKMLQGVWGSASNSLRIIYHFLVKRGGELCYELN